MTYHHRQPGRERADGYRAIIPAFPRVFTCGDSVDDALRMAKDAIELEISVARDRSTSRCGGERSPR
jgi:predicted RNase H-like HicB family nuclease